MASIYRGRDRVQMYLGMLPGLLVYLLFALVPSIATAIISLTNYSGIPGVPASFVGFENYVQAFVLDSQGILGSIRDTLIFAVSVTVIQNALGLFMAHLFTKKYPGRGLFRSLVFMPAALGVTVIGLMWALIFNPSGGPAAALFSLWGGSSAFFGSNSLALPLVILVQIWANLGFTTIVYLAGMNTVPVELYEAAKMDGASGFTSFKDITFPLIAPSTTVNILLSVVGSLNTYDLIYVLTDGLYHTNTLGMYMFNTAFEGSSNLGLAATISMVQFAITLIVALTLQKYLRKREEAL
ncbi:MAG: carbohydrate ABC transporter permease [Bacilli bacterium]